MRLLRAKEILIYMGVSIWRQRVQLDEGLLKLPENMPIGPEDTRELMGRLQELPNTSRELLLPTALLNSVQRFAATRNIQDAATSVRETCETHGDRLDSALSTIRWVSSSSNMMAKSFLPFCKAPRPA